MFLFVGLALLVVLATGLLAEPSLAHHSLIKVPISKRTTGFNGISDFAKRDREHLRNLVARKRDCARRQSSTASKIVDIPLNNTGGIYVATIGVGDPKKECESCRFLPRMVSYIPAQDRLIVDTGSGFTWVGANTANPYVKTKSSVKTKDSVVSVMSYGLTTQLKVNDPVRQDITYSNGFFTGKFTSQELILYIHVPSQALFTTIQLRFPKILLFLSSPLVLPLIRPVFHPWTGS
jgi:hypothetical protein